MTLYELEKMYCSQGDTSGKHVPKKIFVKSQGCFLFDDCGIKYLDMQMFNSASNFGYQNKQYRACLEENMDVLPSLASEFMSRDRILLSEKICAYMYDHYNVKGRVHFTVGGAQAVDDALKLAINYNNKNKFFAFEGGYHGRTMAASSVSSSYRYTKQFGNVLQTTRIPFPNCANCVYSRSSENCNLYCINQFSRLFESEFSGIYDTTARLSAYSAFIFEPVLGRGGYVFPHNKYYPALSRLLHQYNILTIADEVQMGFYRTGKLWSFEHYGIVPDIIVFGKAITNGIWPLSGVWAKEDIISPEKWPTGSTHCTFAGHPLGMALGLCTFNIIEDPSFRPLIEQSSMAFQTCIRNIAKDYDCIGRIQGTGHAVGLDIVSPDTQKPSPQFAQKLVDLALNDTVEIHGERYGLILTVGGMFNSQLMLSPCLYMNEEEVSLFDRLFRHFLDQASMKYNEIES